MSAEQQRILQSVPVLTGVLLNMLDGYLELLEAAK